MPRTQSSRTKKAAAARKRPTMTRAHKAALAAGREEGRAIRNYLDALETHRPRRGRKRTAETVERQLLETIDRLASATALDRVTLVQRKMDLERELAALEGVDTVDLDELEQGFIAAVKGYSERKGITYAAWREAGIDARILRAAGLRRGSSLA